MRNISLLQVFPVALNNPINSGEAGRRPGQRLCEVKLFQWPQVLVALIANDRLAGPRPHSQYWIIELQKPETCTVLHTKETLCARGQSWQKRIDRDVFARLLVSICPHCKYATLIRISQIFRDHLAADFACRSRYAS